MPAPELACLDGAIGPAADARIPATDDGLLRGDGAFEVIRIYAGRPFALDEHLERLEGSAANLRLEADRAAVARDAAQVLDAAGAYDGLLRIVLTRGGRRLLLTEPLPQVPPTLALTTVVYSPPRILDGVKSLSYAANMLAGRLARERGADEALLVTPHGRALELPTGSFFWIVGDVVRTVPLDEHVLDSITRRHVMAVQDVDERPCPPDELERAEEAFVASTVREVLPIASIDGRAIGASAPGPRTEAIAGRLRERIESALAAG